MTAPEDYPRVLVMAVNPINRMQSNGLLMGSFFQGWPEDRLAQIYFPFFHRFPPDRSICRHYLRVNPFGLTKRLDFPDGDSDADAQSSKLGTALRRMARSRSLRARVIDPLREILPLSSSLDRELIRYGRDFEPDLIYTLLGTIGVARAAALVSNDLGCPIVPHFTDHWIDTRFVGSPFESHFRHRLAFWLQRVVDRSPVLMAVTGSMAAEYSRRFEKDCLFLTNVVDKEPYLRAEGRATPGGTPLRLVYAGNLGLERWKVLLQVGLALRKLKNEGIEARLEIHCSEDDRVVYQHRLELPGVVKVGAWVPPAELPDLLTAADVLVHVESQDPSLLRYTRFSFSTKLSQYMMAGRCLFLVGPPEAGSMQEVSRMGGGVLVAPDTSEELEQALRRVLTDHQFRRSMGEKARNLALQYFEGQSQRRRFLGILRTAASTRTEEPALQGGDLSPGPHRIASISEPPAASDHSPELWTAATVAAERGATPQSDGEGRLLQAFSWVVLANLTRQISFLLVNVILFERLSRSTFGALVLAYGYMQVFAGLGELGIRQIGWREVARRPDHAVQLAGPYFSAKTLAGGLSMAAYWLFMPLLWTNDESRAIYLLFGLGVLINGGMFDFPLFGLHRIDLIAKYSLISFGIYLVGCVLLVTRDGRAWVVPLLFAGSMAILFVLELRWFRRTHGKFRLRWRSTEILSIVRDSWLLGAGETLNRLVLGYPIILTGMVLGSESVGNYRIAEIGYSFLAQFGHMFATAGFSHLSRRFVHSPSDLARTIARMLGLVLLVAVPAAAAMSLIAPGLYVLGFAQVSNETLLVLRVLGLALVFAAPVRFLKALLASIDQQRLVLAINALAIALGAGAGWLLLPEHHILGMAAAVVLAEATSLAVLIWVYWRTLRRSADLVATPTI